MIEEVECNGFGQPILLFEKTIPASDGVQPANFFLDHSLTRVRPTLFLC